MPIPSPAVKRPDQQRDAAADQQRRRVALEELDALDAAQDDRHLQQPEDAERDRLVAASTSAQPDVSVVISVSSASAPIHVWIPNQPHATSARAIAATFAPRMPKLERTSTGNGIPYFVPGCELSRIGISTMRLPSETVSSPCHHVMPAAIRPEASV